MRMCMCMWVGGRHPYVQLGMWQGEKCMEEKICTVCVTERDGFQIQITLPSAFTRLFTGVSTFCVLLYELTQSKRIYCHNTQRVLKCVCPGVCVYYSYIHMYVPPGMCGRRAARWLTWAPRPACGWIPTVPCTSPRRGRVTSEHTPAGWPQWVAMTPAVPTSESGLHICLMTPLSYLAVCFFFVLFTSDRDMMDGCFPRCCGLSPLSSLIHQTL